MTIFLDAGPTVSSILEDTVRVLIYLHWGESVVLQEGQSDDWHQQELHTESVVL